MSGEYASLFDFAEPVAQPSAHSAASVAAGGVVAAEGIAKNILGRRRGQL